MNVYERLDYVRRWQGGLLDAIGLGPVETPSHIILSHPVFTLKAYGDVYSNGPVMLIVPAPIKRAYIWDLDPQVSVILHCLRENITIYLLQWEMPGSDEQSFGLRDYSDEFICACLDAIERDAGQRRVFLAGHSLGGTFCAIFASLHTQRVRGLILLGAPIQFGAEMGAIDSLIAASPKAMLYTAQLGNVPGTFISLMSNLASPESYQGERWSDLLHSLSDHNALRMHARVNRWTFDELPMPRQLFEDITELLYRENRFMSGNLEIDGWRAEPEYVWSPILSVADERSLVVTPRSSLAFHDAASSPDKQVLWYGGDVGVALQHVGMLVGKNAHEQLWPRIITWMRER